MTTVAQIQEQTQYKMTRSIETLRENFTKLRTGRASTGLLDHIHVEYYGSMSPLSQVANLGVADARTLTVQPWDSKMIPMIEKAIMQSDLGLNPATNGNVIRIPLPPLTEERRRELTKVVRHEGEEAKVAVRNLRREANEGVKKLEKAKEISEDDVTRAEKDIQKLTDKYIAEIDQLVANKEKEVMTV
ncbi:MAG: ribosome recycling factor [Duodenibacillus sp.]|jgi:ribosome recycling factor|nr:ribosome recycling factor [Duodenibacillus sp.]